MPCFSYRRPASGGQRTEAPATGLDLIFQALLATRLPSICMSSRRWANWAWSTSFSIPQRLGACCMPPTRPSIFHATGLNQHLGPSRSWVDIPTIVSASPNLRGETRLHCLQANSVNKELSCGPRRELGNRDSGSNPLPKLDVRLYVCVSSSGKHEGSRLGEHIDIRPNAAVILSRHVG